MPQADHIAALFASTDKLLRALRLYEGKGSLVERGEAELQRRAEAALGDGEFTVRVTPVGVMFEGTLLQPGEAPQYLFQLFLDGVRELTFKPGIPAQELRRLAEVFATDPRSDADDTVTLLWKAGFKHIRYYATDTLGTEVEDAGDLAGEQEAGLAGDDEGTELVVSADDLRMLRSDESLSWAREAVTAYQIPEIPSAEPFTAEADVGRFVALGQSLAEPGEASPMVLGVFDAALRAVDVDAVLGVLSGAQGALGQALLHADRLEGLAAVVERTPEPALAAIEALQVDTDALVPLLTYLPAGPAQKALQAVLEARGVELTAFYTQRLHGEDVPVILDAIQALSRTETDAASRELTNALGHKLTEVRAAALEAMVGRYVPEARVALGRALRDPVAENRLLALKVLRESGEGRAAGPILSAAQDAGFANRAPDEQNAFYEALAAFKDPRTVAFFKKLVDSANVLRNARTNALQLRAIDALGQIGTAEARGALEELAGRWRTPAEIKKAAKAALGRFR